MINCGPLEINSCYFSVCIVSFYVAVALCYVQVQTSSRGQAFRWEWKEINNSVTRSIDTGALSFKFLKINWSINQEFSQRLSSHCA